MSSIPESKEQRLDLSCRKTRMCKYFTRGSCFAKRCNFAHSQAELQSRPNLNRTKMCPIYQDSGACTMPGCTFAHSRAELRKVCLQTGIEVPIKVKDPQTRHSDTQTRCSDSSSPPPVQSQSRGTTLSYPPPELQYPETSFPLSPTPDHKNTDSMSLTYGGKSNWFSWLMSDGSVSDEATEHSLATKGALWGDSSFGSVGDKDTQRRLAVQGALLSKLLGTEEDLSPAQQQQEEFAV